MNGCLSVKEIMHPFKVSLTPSCFKILKVTSRNLEITPLKGK